MASWNAFWIGAYVWLLSIPQQGPGVTFIDLDNVDPQPTFFDFILGTFKLIGIAILVVAAIGALVGLVRIWVRRKFPENPVNGIDTEPLTFLHLNESPEAPGAPAADA